MDGETIVCILLGVIGGLAFLALTCFWSHHNMKKHSDSCKIGQDELRKEMHEGQDAFARDMKQRFGRLGKKEG